jgi:hypothetical protein
VNPYLDAVERFQADVHQILSVHEQSPSRIVVLDETYRKLGNMSLRQDDLMRQALRCIENDLYRAAHVMAWAAFVDFLEEKLSSDGLVRLRALRPSWTGADIGEMAESVPEFQFVELTKPIGLCSKAQMRDLLALLNRRNQCAHPTDYYPDLNMTLGYVAEILQHVSRLQAKSI